ncbi:hypothetical protein L8106_20033 [Lyngbya sp. PCC 8106]|nr:hypothetical protein L8106_20033 [Lyngbya sp. PCC 8106]
MYRPFVESDSFLLLNSPRRSENSFWVIFISWWFLFSLFLKFNNSDESESTQENILELKSIPSHFSTVLAEVIKEFECS